MNNRFVAAPVGSGNIVLRRQGDEAVFSHLSYCYPLKLLSPRTSRPATAVSYLINYGGGLVGGDKINLNVDVGFDTRLLLLTQSSTKVFKERKQKNSSSTLTNTTQGFDQISNESVSQNLVVYVGKNALLMLLPDPVTCFSDACYTQLQVFKLEKGASITILDWITSGRMYAGENWDFRKYHSINEVWVDNKRVFRDALLLDKESSSRIPGNDLSDRMGDYSCYATVFMYGPLMRATMEILQEEYNGISIFQNASHSTLIWSLSETAEGAIVIRIAGLETELVRDWLKHKLQTLAHIIGNDIYSKAFA